MRRIVGSFGIAFVVLISSTRGPLKTTLRLLGMATELMALKALKKRMNQHQRLNKMMNPCSDIVIRKEMGIILVKSPDFMI